MSYLVLARKYRPGIFSDVVGQEHITDLLQKAISANRVAHAFLFCGPRGIGKTSCARILAKSLNCKKGPTVKPCGECPACREITQGNSFDVMEIDGASNRGIDEIRALRENVKFAPSGANKIYIVDEVHMLTTEAFNALLKTLEEPPERVIFILATTDPYKVPGTIISRCQRCDFKRITIKVLAESLLTICEKEKIEVAQDALYAIAKAAQGSFRDALSILDQVSALGEKKIKGEHIYSMFGIVELDRLFALTDALTQNDCILALRTFDEIIDAGKDIKQLSRDLVEHFRNLMVIKIGGKALGRLVDYPTAVKEMYLQQSQKISLADILKAIDIFVEAQDIARITETLRTPLEVAFAKLTFTGVTQNRHQQETKSVEQAPAQVAPLVPDKVQKSSFPKYSPVGILKNQKGQVNVPSGNVEESDEPENIGDPQTTDITAINLGLDLERIRKSWSALTFAVSRKKMSLATYLQEGSPVAFNGEKITVGFSGGFEFHKETLENDEYRKVIDQIFTEQLKQPIRVEYTVIGDMKQQHHEEDEPLVKSVLETFRGRIVNKWHNE
jgi:DNA polymerase III subunit gamma/tau